MGTVPISRKRLSLILLLPILSSILLAAHFSRIQNDWLALFALLFPFILLIKRGWILRIYQVYMLAGGIIWIDRALYLRQLRLNNNEPWLRLAIILFGVALITVVSALILQKKKIHHIYTQDDSGEAKPYAPSLVAFFLAGTLLTIIQLKMTPPILLLERFLPGAGMVEVILLALYAAWITEILLEAVKSSVIRSRIWILFSSVFFSQYILGLTGVEKCLMTGKLHLPIPALILGGPIFRGSGFFMPILFVSTVVLVGAAWCSFLCYIGSWDNLICRRSRSPKVLPEWWRFARILILILVVLLAYLFRLAGLSSAAATGLAILFGLGGIGVMICMSRRNGIMTHCTIYCPIGLVSDLAGRINPFRIRFTQGCDECGACRLACRYHALTESDIGKRRPGISCTLCGDCLPSCGKGALEYKFLGLKPDTVRKVFIILVVSLHAVFLGIARI